MGRVHQIDSPGRSRKHRLDPGEIDEAPLRFDPGDLHHQVGGVIFAERVVEDIGRESRLLA